MKTFRVYDVNADFLGEVTSIGEAKRLQEKAMPEELLPYYAGLDCGQLLRSECAAPCFFADTLPKALAEKYGIGVDQ